MCWILPFHWGRRDILPGVHWVNNSILHFKCIYRKQNALGDKKTKDGSKRKLQFCVTNQLCSNNYFSMFWLFLYWLFGGRSVHIWMRGCSVINSKTVFSHACNRCQLHKPRDQSAIPQEPSTAVSQSFTTGWWVACKCLQTNLQLSGKLQATLAICYQPKQLQKQYFLIHRNESCLSTASSVNVFLRLWCFDRLVCIWTNLKQHTRHTQCGATAAWIIKFSFPR